jgi:hypothetical protein
LSDEIQTHRVRPQPEQLTHIARQPRTQISSARTDQQHIDFLRAFSSLREGPPPSRSRDVRSILREPRVQSIRINRKRFFQAIKRQVTRFNSILAQ